MGVTQKEKGLPRNLITWIDCTAKPFRTKIFFFLWGAQLARYVEVASSCSSSLNFLQELGRVLAIFQFFFLSIALPIHLLSNFLTTMGTFKKEAARKDRQGKVKGDPKVKGENFYR